jgi:UDP-sulfoquinovose synthase
MRFLITGGAGYLAWPLARRLEGMGYQVLLVDNFLKKRLLEVGKIAPLGLGLTITERIELSKSKIAFHELDVCDSQKLRQLLAKYRPDIIIHLGQIPSAPYSVSSIQASWNTIQNNLCTTNNLAWCINELALDCHLVKLGTMGEYGTPNVPIPEGFVDIEIEGRTDRFLMPRRGGSVYHVSKIMDTDLLHFYTRCWNLRVSDIMQGPVFGVSDRKHSDDFPTDLYYDSVWGTVINRFVVQAVAGYPLTVYGEGGQKRGYLSLEESVDSLVAVALNPPQRGDYSVYNQFSECLSVLELAKLVASAASECGIQDCQYRSIPNPRVEDDKNHYYSPQRERLRELGVSFRPITSKSFKDIFQLAMKYVGSIDPKVIDPNISWT